MSAVPETLSLSARPGWRLAGGLTAALVLAMALLFWPTLHSMIQVWERSETFAHGYLIFPISAWLIWRRRRYLAQLAPQADARALLLLGLAGAGWLLAEAGSVNVVAQYAFVAMLIAAVWAVLGLQVVRAIFFPLMFLFFAVPVGEFLIPPLMDFTADFTVAALKLTGIPVVREGTFFSIPSGDWSVVEGCSGLRYLIASATVGTLYAYLTYRSWKRRLLFAIASVVVPIIANGGRAYMIVMIAHLSDMKLALGIDHYIYGWVFFGIVMMLLFWIGAFWREDDQPEAVSALQVASLPGRASSKPLPTAVAALLIAMVWPAYGHWLDNRPLPEMPDIRFAAEAGWQDEAAFTDWSPHWLGADRQFRRGYGRDGQQVLLEINYYATQRQDAELVNSQNYMIQQKHPIWANVGEGIATVEIAGQPRQVRQARLKSHDGRRLLVWQWSVIDGRTMVNDHLAKLVLAFDRVRLSRDDGASVLIAAPYAEDPAEAAAVLARFVADNEPALARALAEVAGQ